MIPLAAVALVLAQDAVKPIAVRGRFSEKYEFALRLRSLDRAWLEHRDEASRKRALPHLESAGEALRSSVVTEAAHDIDRARFALHYESAHSPPYNSLAVIPRRRLCDAGEASIPFAVTRLYGKEILFLATGFFSAAFVDDPEVRLNTEFDPSYDCGGDFKLAGAYSGDRAVRTQLFDGDFDMPQRTMTISIVEKRDERLAALEKAVAALTEKAPRLERETASALLALLKSLATGSTEETDYPGARLLAEAEQVVAAAAKGERWYGPEHAGQFFLALPTGSTTTRARILVPDGLSVDTLTPLVVALHGRVFSEHTWFECYGAGEAVKQCAQRKWIFAAPRFDAPTPPSIASVVDAIAAAYPVDRSKVFLVGHSMGGGLGLAAVRSSPKSFRAFASIGAGQALDDTAALKDLPIFIAAGDHDFARDGAEALHKSLAAAGSTRATLKIFPNAEHWMTVADALPDVFAFFDAALR